MKLNTYEQMHYNFIKENEPLISAHLLAICSKFDVTLGGFNHRIKTEESLCEKLNDRDEKVDITTLNDICRYTILIPKNEYCQKTLEILNLLQITGSENVKFTNHWNLEGKYQGINAAFKTGDMTYEVQFHTPQSYMTKHKTHKIYEMERICKDENKIKEYQEQQKTYFNKVEHPDNVMCIKLDNLCHINQSINNLNLDEERLNIEASPLLDYLQSIYTDEKNFQIISSMRGSKSFALTKHQTQMLLENKVTPQQFYDLQQILKGPELEKEHIIQKNIHSQEPR